MSSHILTEVDKLATRIGIIHNGRLIEELDTDKLENLRSKRLEIRTGNLAGAQTCLQNLGYKPILEDKTILLEEAHAVEHPDEIAQMLVNAAASPTHLAVEQQNLEDHFMQLTRGSK